MKDKLRDKGKTHKLKISKGGSSKTFKGAPERYLSDDPEEWYQKLLEELSELPLERSEEAWDVVLQRVQDFLRESQMEGIMDVAFALMKDDSKEKARDSEVSRKAVLLREIMEKLAFAERIHVGLEQLEEELEE